MPLPHLIATLTVALLAGSVQAETPAAFKDADLKLGERLIAQNKCNQCHARDWGNDGKAIYRPQGRINSAGALLGMVDRCTQELNLGLFPEEIAAMAAALNRDHYHFSR